MDCLEKLRRTGFNLCKLGSPYIYFCHNNGKYGKETAPQGAWQRYEDVMECLDGGAPMEDAIELFDSKELDGPIYMNAQNLILNFSKKGPEFEEAYNEKHNIKISDSRKEAIERIKAENKSFAGKQL